MSTFTIYGRNGDWRWRLTDADGAVIARSLGPRDLRYPVREQVDEVKAVVVDAPIYDVTDGGRSDA